MVELKKHRKLRVKVIVEVAPYYVTKHNRTSFVSQAEGILSNFEDDVKFIRWLNKSDKLGLRTVKEYSITKMD